MSTPPQHQVLALPDPRMSAWVTGKLIIGHVPLDSGCQTKLGVDKGPIYVFFDDHQQFEHTPLPPSPTPNEVSLNDSPVSTLDASLAKRKNPPAKAHAEKGQLPVTLCGNHSLAMGTVPGTLRVAIESTDNGNIYRMSLSFSYCPQTRTRFSLSTIGPPEHLIYIGLRDVEKGDVHEVDRYGIGMVVEMAPDHVNPQRDRPIYLSFDVDALDSSVPPSTGTPVRGGLNFRDGHYVCEAIHETGLFVALDLMVISEVNPAPADAETVRPNCYSTIFIGALCFGRDPSLSHTEWRRGPSVNSWWRCLMCCMGLELPGSRR
ncbi:Arginase/deacetylase [Rhizopogon vinicolor AM-OR11-026]|uniref:Arginase/deacetylase n=1 Tax=Rhizopogon vinicolor AM-OR11-026 TaxID=1314800 RepID=A0A1B7N601_9AGAM|nr:Arginase/deacetylase [Rhizopogon vinicolor AM-OR11-026]